LKKKIISSFSSLDLTKRVRKVNSEKAVFIKLCLSSCAYQAVLIKLCLSSCAYRAELEIAQGALDFCPEEKVRGWLKWSP
jgi:hypothetical protein